LLLCSAWFDELRKQRVAELRRELRKSESFIGLVFQCHLVLDFLAFSHVIFIIILDIHTSSASGNASAKLALDQMIDRMIQG
jgi:hypothetical protein